MILELALTLAVSQGGHPSAATRELEQIERQLAAAWQKGDCSAWGALVAPEWSVIHITGDLITRVVTGRTIVTTGGAKPRRLTLRFTDVFIRRTGRWQVVASHATRLGS